MYKSMVIHDNSYHDYVGEILDELNHRLGYNQRKILGFDGITWEIYIYDFVEGRQSLPGDPLKYHWRKLTFEEQKYDTKMYGDAVIQNLISRGHLTIVQELTPDEHEIQRALGTILEGTPQKVCTISTCVKKVEHLLSL